MAGIDPSMVRAFVAGVDQARGHATAALGAFDQLGAAGAGAGAVLDDVALEVDLLALTLRDAAGQPTTHAAASAARELAMHGRSDLHRSLSGLREAIDRAGGATNSADVVRRASEVRAQLSRTAHWDIEELGRKALDPMPNEDPTLGALTSNGLFRSFRDTADAELAAAAGTIDAEHAHFADELADIGRSVDEDGVARSGDDALDDAIAIDELQRSLDDGSFAARLDATAATGDSVVDGAAAELRAAHPLDQHVDGVVAGTRLPDGVTHATVPAARADTPLLAGELTMDDGLGTMLYRSRIPTKPMVELALQADGPGTRLPRFEDAVATALRDTNSTYAILPHADGGWQLARASVPHVDGDHYQRAAETIGRGDASFTGFREQGVRIEALVTHGTVHPLSRPDAGAIDGAVAAGAQALDAGAALARTTRATLGSEGLPTRAISLLDVDVPAGTLARARTVQLSAGAGRDPRIVEGTIDDAFDAAKLRVTGAERDEAVAVIRLDVGRYGIVGLDTEQLSGGALRRMLADLDSGRIRPTSEYDIVAVAGWNGKDPVRLVDLRPQG